MIFIKAYIIDTTLREGEQMTGMALGINDKVRIAKILEKLGVYQLEAGIPAMDGAEKLSIKRIVELGLKCKISTWNRISINDIKHSIDCNPDLIHISVPSSDLLIKYKLGKNRKWVSENMKKCINYALNKRFKVSIGFEDASRADIDFIIELCNEAINESVDQIRYTDTVGILHKNKLKEDIKKIKNNIKSNQNIKIEFHGHNDLGMAVSNSIMAVASGAEFINCTIGGIGERAGLCNFKKFVKSAQGILNIFNEISLDKVKEDEKKIFDIIKTPIKLN